MEHVVRFRTESVAKRLASVFQVFMATALATREIEKTPEPSAPPRIFTGTAAAPLQFRNLLTGLHNVVESRFHRPDLWRYLDPVVTSGSERLRMECFSSCAGVYARVDLTPDAFSDGEFHREGTTNVDFGAAFMRNLALLRPGEKADFEMGEDSVALTGKHGTTVEHKVSLPERWVRGFLQVQAVQRRAAPVFELKRLAARQLIHSIPANARDTVHIVPKTNQPQILHRKPATGETSIAVSGAHRLRLLQAVLPDVQALRVYKVPDTDASVWVADTGTANFTLAVSSQVQHGFSGDGDALRSLTGAEPDDVAVALGRTTAAQLNAFTPEEFAVGEGISVERAVELLDSLSTHGLLGYDRDADRYFYRVLPFLPDDKKLPSRLKGSRDLLAGERVEIDRQHSEGDAPAASGWVKGDSGTYFVKVETDAAGYLRDGSCTCPWIQRNGLKRGPCKHMLALRFACTQEKDQ